MIKSETVTVPNWGAGYADVGKTFVITTMPATQAEKWAWKLFLALKGTAGNIPMELVERLGMVGVGVVGLNALLAAPVKFEEIEPLLDEMLTCVRMVRDPARYPDVVTIMTPTDIEDVRTIGWLRSEVLRIHTGFSAADFLSTLLTAAGTSADSLNTQTSPQS